LLTELNQQGTTIILTTHYLEEAEHLCKKIAIIDHGEIIKHCPMSELLKEVELRCLVMDLDEPLASPPNINNLNCKLSDPHSLEIQVDKQVSLNDIFSELSKLNIKVLNVRNKSNRLEQMFLDLIQENAKAKS